LIPLYKDSVTDWLRTETTEMIIAIKSKKADDTIEVPLIKGITNDQGKRCCERISMKMLIDSRVPLK